MSYSVKANEFVRDTVIHRSGCSEVRKRGGEPGKYGQVHWADFATVSQAEQWAAQWVAKGYKGPKRCRRCSP